MATLVRGWSPAAVTRLLTGVLALTASVLTARSLASAPDWTYVARPALVAAITVTFFLAEQFLVQIEFRRQSHSLTFAGVPLVVGVLALPIHDLVLARLVSALAALILQRISVDKIAYNTAAYIFEAAVVSSAVHAWLPGATSSVPRVGLLVLIIALSDQVMSVLVLCVIRMHAGPLSRPDIVEVLAPSALLSVTATIFALAVIILSRDGIIGDGVVAILAAVGIVIYRAFASMSRQHQSLRVVHDFVTVGVGAHSLQQLGYQALDEVCRLLRAGQAQLMMFTAEEYGDPTSHTESEELLELGVTYDGLRHHTATRLDPGDWVRAKALRHGVPTLVSKRSKDSALTRWLESEAVSDAIVAPLLIDATSVGLVTVAGRLGDTATFTDHDMHLLETLLGHLALALRSTRLVEKLSHDATHDSLTGLFNRAHLNDVIARSNGEQATAVMLLDLNKFKEVNDVLGHDVGDRLLCIIADRLLACLPSSATVARLGGDEFAVLLRDLGPLGAEQAMVLAKRACEHINRAVQFAEAVLSPAASIGIALQSGGDSANLLRCADTAMYVAKATQQDAVLYDPEMDRGRAERLALVADLRTAIDSRPEQFSVHYQPKISLIDGTVVSAEALLRWNHPTLGLITPDRFIPMAETSGLIDQLTQHVLTQALSACARWNRAGFAVSVAVNLSARNLMDTCLPERVSQMLHAAGVPAELLILEITESSVIEDRDQVLPVLERLTELGTTISLDDFGTGFSSLSYLRQLPVRELKIDRSFVTGLTSDTGDNARALIATIAALGESLDLRIVAEGIETPQQQAILAELGCHVGQGYLISRGLPADSIIAWLAHHAAKPLRLLSA
jgi:diguanylate cyclase (GGDEF)-like protein